MQEDHLGWESQSSRMLRALEFGLMDRLKVGWELIDGKTLDSRVIEISKHQIMDF
jgi:hypothetical protein